MIASPYHAVELFITSYMSNDVDGIDHALAMLGSVPLSDAERLSIIRAHEGLMARATNKIAFIEKQLRRNHLNEQGHDALCRVHDTLAHEYWMWATLVEYVKALRAV